jgi:LPXTG-site transpeptidase (sortase) family protein
LILAACAPIGTNIPATLPPPIVQITRAPDISPTALLPAPPTPTPAQIPLPKSDIQQLADELFGARQIQSISIPALDITGDVTPVGWRVNFHDDLQDGAFEWDNPNENVGWVITSVLPDEVGNVILYGHNNIYGKIFQNLYQIKEGEKIYLQAQNKKWEYKVHYVLLLPILGADEEQVKDYQRYLQPTQDSRVTIISCYPPQSNTHRVVVIAK